MSGDFAVIPGNLLLKFREAGVDPGKNKLVKFRETCLLNRRRQAATSVVMCATAAAAGAFVIAAAVALCALPCILAVAEDDRVSNEVQGLDGKQNQLRRKLSSWGILIRGLS